MQAMRAEADPVHRHRDGVVAEDGLARVVALHELYRVAAANVDCRDQIHEQSVTSVCQRPTSNASGGCGSCRYVE